MLSRKELNLPKYPEKIIQFGEGNFLRMFCRLAIRYYK